MTNHRILSNSFDLKNLISMYISFEKLFRAKKFLVYKHLEYVLRKKPSIIKMNSSSLNQTFDQFLNSLSLFWLIDIVYLYIVPLIGISGTILNIINVWIFSHNDFGQPSFFYLRVMSGFHLVNTFLVIAYGICFSPRFLPRVNTYYTALVQLIYVPIG
jgi:hypothetical protein